MVKNGTLASPAMARASKRLAGAGRADEQDAARNPPAEPLELLRIAQEFDDLLQIFLGFVDAGHVLERDAAMRLGQELGLRLAEAHGFAAGPLHLPRQEDPDAEEGDQRQAVDEQRHQPGIAVRRRLGRDRDVLGVELLHQRRIVRRIGGEGPVVLQIMAGDLVAGDRHVANIALVDILQELAEGDLLRLRLAPRVLEQHDQRNDEKKNDDPEGEVPEIRIHNRPA